MKMRANEANEVGYGSLRDGEVEKSLRMARRRRAGRRAHVI